MTSGQATALAGLLLGAAVLAWPSRARAAPWFPVRRPRIPGAAGSGGPPPRRGGEPGEPAGRSWVRHGGPAPRNGQARDRRSNRAGPERLEVSATVVMDLVAAALVAGLPEPQAVAAAAEVCGPGVQARLAQPLAAWRLGIPAEQAWACVDPAFAPLGRSLVLAERTGASAAVVLTAAASDARASRQRRALVAARRLGVQLVLPLGLTTLPAFVMWGVVPVVLGLAEQLLVER